MHITASSTIVVICVADLAYSPDCRETEFPDTRIHPVASLWVRTGAEPRLEQSL
jgi:hypothetical protein